MAGLKRIVFTCQECGKGTLFNRNELNRRGRTRCTGCGSARLEPSKPGRKDLARVEAERAEVKASPGSIVPAKED